MNRLEIFSKILFYIIRIVDANKVDEFIKFKKFIEDEEKNRNILTVFRIMYLSTYFDTFIPYTKQFVASGIIISNTFKRCCCL